MSNSEKKDNLSNSKATPTTFQIFFWKVAGSEISILERCPTDWNKHVGIGMAIFMTTLLAFFSGAYAAYFFTESLIASSAFGLLWAALIYSVGGFCFFFSAIFMLKRYFGSTPNKIIIKKETIQL
jgi:hypothetical protein